MNLGQAMGIDKLRILQLEDELEARQIRIVHTSSATAIVPAHSAPRPMPGQNPPVEAPMPRLVRGRAAPEETLQAPRVHEVLPPAGRGGSNRGIGQRVHEALPDHPPGETVAEIAAILGDITPKKVSAWMFQFDDIARTGTRRRYRYYRKATA